MKQENGRNNRMKGRANGQKIKKEQNAMGTLVRFSTHTQTHFFIKRFADRIMACKRHV